jgi:hypothetical protein
MASAMLCFAGCFGSKKGNRELSVYTISLNFPFLIAIGVGISLYLDRTVEDSSTFPTVSSPVCLYLS